MSKSNYLEAKVLDHFLGTSSTSSPSGSVYLAILSVASADGTITEITGDNYTATDLDGTVTSGNRPRITFASATTVSGTTTADGPVSDIEYDNTSGSQFTVAGFGLYDSANASGTNNLLYWGALSSSKDIDAGDSIRFEASDAIQITEE